MMLMRKREGENGGGCRKPEGRMRDGSKRLGSEFEHQVGVGT